MHTIDVCSTCKGSKWVRGLVGGVYECPDCWMHEQNKAIINETVNDAPELTAVIKKKGRPRKGV